MLTICFGLRVLQSLSGASCIIGAHTQNGSQKTPLSLIKRKLGFVFFLKEPPLKKGLFYSNVYKSFTASENLKSCI